MASTEKTRAGSHSARLIDRGVELALDVVLVVEFAIAIIIMIALIFGVAYFASALLRLSVARNALLTSNEIHSLLDVSLVLFVGVELFRISLTYIRREDVVPIVLEAAFVAVSRKIVLFEVGKGDLAGAAALGILLVGIAITYVAFRYARPEVRAKEK